MTEVIVRQASADDAPALSGCIDAAYSVYASRITDLPDVSEGILQDIENHLVWVAEQDQSVVGGVVLIAKDRFAVLANIAVDPKYAGQGHGRRLMDVAETECRLLGLRELRLNTHVDMPENVRFYQRLGWQETGRSGNKVLMAKFLQAE